MIYIKDGTLEKIEKWTESSMHVLTDFDRTITAGDSDSSWGILSKSNLVPKEYVMERQALFNYYRPIEIDESLEYETKNKLMCEWWNKHIKLLIKYQLSEKVINEAVCNPDIMVFRKGAKKFLECLKNKNIPVIIISAGIGNFIEKFLVKNECYFDNIYIISNFIKFENGIATGISGDIIHSLNKNQVSLPNDIVKLIDGRTDAILLGDSVSDIKMAKEECRQTALKVGFLNENEEENKKYFEDQFDIVCTENSDYNNLLSVIKILN